jgi:hypothetical protein
LVLRPNVIWPNTYTTCSYSSHNTFTSPHPLMLLRSFLHKSASHDSAQISHRFLPCLLHRTTDHRSTTSTSPHRLQAPPRGPWCPIAHCHGAISDSLPSPLASFLPFSPRISGMGTAVAPLQHGCHRSLTIGARCAWI